jgi:hypothetical protein
MITRTNEHSSSNVAIDLLRPLSPEVFTLLQVAVGIANGDDRFRKGGTIQRLLPNNG